jgi:hypothetical protein
LVNDAVAAVRGFWAGGDEENPEWVLTTAACIFEDEVPFESTVSSTRDSFNSFVDEYDEETSGFWRFECQNEQHSRYLEWVADILIEELLLEGPEMEGERHVFTETMRLHSRGPVVLWTNLFGPVNQSFQEWPYNRLLNDITEFQQGKLDAVSDETIDFRSLGDFA